MRSTFSALVFALLLVAVSLPARLFAADDADAPWEIAKADGCAIAVPRAWENLDRFTPTVLIFRKSKSESAASGEEVPAEPQLQIVVEKVKVDPELEPAMNVIAGRIIAEPKTDAVSRPIAENIKLADETPAMIMNIEVIRDGKLRQLLLKLLVKTDARSGYIVSGTISAAKESKIPTADSAESKWLRELVKSMVLNAEKLNVQKVKDAFAERDKNK